MTGAGKQARVEPSFGGQSRPRATLAEGLCHRRDHADLAPAVGVPVTERHLTGIVRALRLQRVLAADGLHNPPRRDHVIKAPAVGGAYVHVLDKAHDEPALATEARKVKDAGVIDVALDHG